MVEFTVWNVVDSVTGFVSSGQILADDIASGHMEAMQDAARKEGFAEMAERYQLRSRQVAYLENQRVHIDGDRINVSFHGWVTLDVRTVEQLPNAVTGQLCFWGVVVWQGRAWAVVNHDGFDMWHIKGDDSPSTPRKIADLVAEQNKQLGSWTPPTAEEMLTVDVTAPNPY